MEPKDLRLDTPADYTIQVVGNLDATWADRFGGLTIKSATTGNGECTTITTISSRMADQATLIGLINALYDYRYPLLSVDCRSCNEGIL